MMAGYVELHCHSAFSLREGASLPLELVLRAKELGYPALALTDHDGLYGAMEFAQAARAWDLHPITGAEVSVPSFLDIPPQPGAAVTTGPAKPHAEQAGSHRAVAAGRASGASSTPFNRGSLLLAVPRSPLPTPRSPLPPSAPAYHLTMLAATRAGYAALCRTITMNAERGAQSAGLGALAGCTANGCAHHRADSALSGLEPACAAHGAYRMPPAAHDLVVLTGCRHGEVARLVDAGDSGGAETVLRRYREWFGEGNVYVEVQQNFVRGDTARIRELVRLARRVGLPVVATNNVHYHVQQRSRLHDVLVAIRNHTTLDGSHVQRRANGEFYLKSAAQMQELFRELPEALRNTLVIAERCTFNLAADLDYAFPGYHPDTGESADDFLARICREELARRYAPLGTQMQGQAKERLAEELRLIRLHKLAGFFLHYRDLLITARAIADEVYGRDPHHPRDWYPPGRGRGSSVGSIVCYLIGLSHIDPIKTGLFLGRFLNEELSSVPDIDLDFPRKVRERLLERLLTDAERGTPAGEQRRADVLNVQVEHDAGAQVALRSTSSAFVRNPHAGMVCIFPTYQLRSAVRDIGKALGLPEAELDKLAKSSGWSGAKGLAEEMGRLPDFAGRVDAPLWRDLVQLAAELDGMPRHVSQHVGGIVLSARPLTDHVPLQPAAMPGRFLIAWDKDSVDDARFIKIDFLALGMLSLVDECLDLIRERRGQFPDLGRIPHDDPRVYDMICRGDTLGIFQIESRAQIQTLPRTRPRTIADLTIEVAIIRPGPISGGALNPYILRRQGRQAVSYDHPLLEPVLKETLGVILFQEQVLQVAMAIAGFSAGQADSLRRAMSRKRSHQAMAQLWEPFRQGALARDVDEATARTVFDKLLGFAAFGFPKSHSAAFALLAYESAWLKLYYPAPYYCALFNNQPMGFYSPAVLVGDARRHGVRVLRPDINRSRAKCTVEDEPAEASRELLPPERGARNAGPPRAETLSAWPEAGATDRSAFNGSGFPVPDDLEVVRLGFAMVEGISAGTAEEIEGERERGGPFQSLPDFVRRTGLRREAVEHLVAAGAFDSFGMGRRESLWLLGLLQPPKAITKRQPAARQGRFDLPLEQDMVRLPEPGRWEQMVDDYRILRLSPDDHPLALLRPRLGEGYITSTMLERLRDGMAVTVAGLVVCRQRPQTAKGFTFLSLEDEFGLINVIIQPALYERRRLVIRTEPFLAFSGLLQLKDGTVNVTARDVHSLRIPPEMLAPRSKDWG